MAPWLEPSCPTDTLSACGPTRLCNAVAVNPSHSRTGMEPGLHPDLPPLGMGPLGHFGVIPQAGNTRLPPRAAALRGGRRSQVPHHPPCVSPPAQHRLPQTGQAAPVVLAEPEPPSLEQDSAFLLRQHTLLSITSTLRAGIPLAPLQDPATGVWTLPLQCRGHRWPHPPPSPIPPLGCMILLLGRGGSPQNPQHPTESRDVP